MGVIKELENEMNFVNNFQHIEYKEKIARAYQELVDTDPSKILKWGRDERDNMLGGIYGGKVYLIGAQSGRGKTTFVNQVCNNVSATGVRVVKYSLEDRMEDLGKEEIYYIVNRLRRDDGKNGYDPIKFINNNYLHDKQYGPEFREEYNGYIMRACEYLTKMNTMELDKQKQVSIDDLIRLMEEECDKGAKLFAIDHLHYFEFESIGERLDLQIQNVMHRINELARKRNVAVLLVAHYRNNTAGEPDPSRFKDGASIKQVANVIIQIDRDIHDPSNTSFFHITKLRGIFKPDVIECQFDLGKYEYSFTKSKEQREKEFSLKI